MDKDIEATITYAVTEGLTKRYIDTRDGKKVAIMGHSKGADAALKVSGGLNTDKLNIGTVLALDPCDVPTVGFSKVDTFLSTGTVSNDDRKLLCGMNNEWPDLFNYWQQANSTMSNAYVSADGLTHNDVITNAQSTYYPYIVNMLECSLNPKNSGTTTGTGTNTNTQAQNGAGGQTQGQTTANNAAATTTTTARVVDKNCDAIFGQSLTAPCSLCTCSTFKTVDCYSKAPYYGTQQNGAQSIDEQGFAGVGVAGTATVVAVAVAATLLFKPFAVSALDL